jgi:hypothetical protein
MSDVKLLNISKEFNLGAIRNRKSEIRNENMSEEARILTLHPDGKKGKNILRSKYEMTRECLMGIFADFPEISHKELTRISNERLAGKLQGAISWYMETVLLDLMARGVIRKMGDKPVRLGIIKSDKADI